jgi:hypothetical protein
MRDFEPGSGPAPGGDARGGGAFYHVSFRSGSRAGGACARASHDYVTREHEYADPDRDAAVYTESGDTSANMRNWMECVASRKTPNADVEAGYSHSVALCMTIAALHTGQRITFDDKKQDVIIGGRDVTTTDAR